MQTLGLSSESKRADGRLKSLFWPTVENAWDVDYLGQQGMWICTILAVLTLVLPALTGNMVLIATGILSALFYLLGGIGVRQGSWPAAAAVFSVYLLNMFISGIGVISVIFAAVLLSNVRAAFLASEWKPVELNTGPGEADLPTRFNETLADKYIDQMPAKLWPKLQIVFLVLAIVMVLLSLVGAGVIAAQRLGLLPHPH